MSMLLLFNDERDREFVVIYTGDRIDKREVEEQYGARILEGIELDAQSLSVWPTDRELEVCG